MQGPDIDDDDLAILDDLPNIAKVFLNHTNITDEGLLQIAELPQLERVVIESRVITKDGVARLRDAWPQVLVKYYH